eukprot:TRINITY_DN40614_c0_g1_i1.p1 TRINITY_DN40614_c0_g1~~TRINITY_DN40614_c0_g1_i1.p1  ORF type:complete len:191 (-),score=25.07 TRINITY_DN40614_c0_g1_i1:77-649(-)
MAAALPPAGQDAGALAEAADAALAWQLQLEIDTAAVNAEGQPQGATVGQTCCRCGQALETDGSCWARSCGMYLVRCPYAGCDRLYEVHWRQVRCAVFRCGGCIYNGKLYQFPQHGSREKVASFLQADWSDDQSWPGWPGIAQGCGRPFRCVWDRLIFSDYNDGEKLTWDDRECAGDPVSMDPDGDYSRIC